MLEEAIRFLFSHPRLAEEPRIAMFAGALLEASSSLTDWRCFATDATAKDDALRNVGPSTAGGGSGAGGEGASSATVTAAGGGGGGGGSPSGKLCSSLLRLISLALTVTKAAARASDGCRPCPSISFDLWNTCSSAVQLFGLPQRMQATRGITALLLSPACCGIRRNLCTLTLEGSPHQTAFSEAAVASLLMFLQSCCNNLPPRLAVDVLMAAPALALVEEEAGRLPQAPASTATVGCSLRLEEDTDNFNGLAATTANYILTLMTSLGCVVFGVPFLDVRQSADTVDRHMLWLSMASDPDGCREGCNLRDGEPFFSAAFQGEAAPELAEESVAVLSRILLSPMWDRVVGYDSTSSESTGDWLARIASSLCYFASILELHPAIRQSSHMGRSTPGGGSAAAAPAPPSSCDGVALAADVPAPLLSGSDHDVGVTSSSQWQDARCCTVEALRLISTHDSQDALVRVLGVALSGMREVLSGIVSQAATSVTGDSLGGIADVAVAVADHNCSGGSLGMRDWECVQSELLLGLPEELWGVRPCCNTACVRLEGPCEMEVKTRACGGGCGARYCCAACQEQAWRGGHRRNCVAMKEMRERFERANNGSLIPVSVDQ